MRHVLLLAHDAPASGDFALEDLPGAGRMDLLARAVTSALLVSHGIRDDVRVHCAIADCVVRFDGATLQGLNPDERSTAARIRSALDRHADLVGRQPITVSPGVEIARRERAELIEDLADAGTLVHLHADGDPVAEVPRPEDPVFVLSDHRPFTDEEAALLADHAVHRVSLGPEALQADQAIVLAHNALDTDRFA